jgi:hypothetical protein
LSLTLLSRAYPGKGEPKKLRITLQKNQKGIGT